MKRSICILATIAFIVVVLGPVAQVAAREFPRSWLWDPNAVKMMDTSKYKKNPPYTIGFSNASISNSWRVFFAREVQAEVEKQKDLIKKFYITDAQDKPDKQIADTEDLVAKGVDLLIVSAATSAALDPIVTRVYKQGIPIVCADRRVTSDNFDSFVTSSSYAMGRIQMVWLCQMLKGKGNIVMLPGLAGAGPAEERIAGGKEVLSQFPGVKLLELQYTSWSPSEGKRIMAALIQSHGKSIDGVWADSGLQGSGAIEALVEAGMKVPITGDHLNAYLTRVMKYKFPAMSIGFPVKMGAESVRVALKILQGIPVPFIVNVTREIVTTVDTEDVKSDVPWDQWVRPDWPDDWWIDNTLPEHWLPK
jgi:ribose transport system substrate-binding protein